MEIEFGDLGGTGSKKNKPKSVILKTKWVAVARIGLILWEIEATGSGEVLRGLLDLWDINKISKMTQNIENREFEKLMKFRIFPICPVWGHTLGS